MNKQYYEVIVKGSYDLAKGFVLGFMEGREISGEAIFEEEQHIKVGGTLAQLIRVSGIKGRKVHVIVGAGFYELLNNAFLKVKDLMDLEVESVRVITDAFFDFHYKAFTRELGDELRGLFDALPQGLSIEGKYVPKECCDPEGKGIETYAPLHDYELTASGQIHGPAKEALDFYRKLELYDMVELGDINLKYAD